MSIKIKIGMRIKELRTANNISQQELAYLCDIDRTYITQVENGKRNISIVNIEKIARALKVSISFFFNDGKFDDN